ncbi:glycosyltransferase [Sulfuricurvum sp.]|uniref:glycosyltransferase n=1 Tax=Sulfuricurvum sp. TaxID=2025608 RepID=UPI0026227A2F|nr:glycosyltransferase [Sulfuricurvum sp.]MDD3595848.1 glycosyltransferase [Sulfuricurvum sp.]
MMHLSFFTKYPTQGATSRYRSFVYISRLTELNYNIEVQSFMPISYLARLFTNRPKPKYHIILSYLERCIAALRSSDHLIIERELLPYIPYAIEKWFLKGKSYILDFDDNVWEDYRGKKLLEGKYDRLVQNAAGVIVGNDYLEHNIKVLNPNIIKIPTVINLDVYSPDKITQKFGRFSLVWIGSSITYRYIESFRSMFQALAKSLDYDLIIIASKTLENRAISGVSMKFYDWSSETEVALLQQSHIGIMPLSDDPFSQGKSGFKLIQYQAAGLPAIASPIGENCTIIQEGVNGFLPKTDKEWIDAITHLYNHSDLCTEFSQYALQNAYNFSIQKYLPVYIRFINKIFDKTPRKRGT